MTQETHTDMQFFIILPDREFILSNVETLPAFSLAEKELAHRLLAHTVSHMMGRKMEEADWTSVYCAAKRIPTQDWSNLNIDVMHGPLGVEQKMLCYRAKPSLLDACGSRLMHPAATRSIRIKDLDGDPNEEMRSIFGQYEQLLAARRRKVAEIGNVDESVVDLRTGWLLWQVTLKEFLYFEEPMIAPDPDEYTAMWVDSASGARKGSRNLWIYEKETGLKKYSVTTTAGAKIQPYFDVPLPSDPNLYHWMVIGEVITPGLIRVWLTKNTADSLLKTVGSLDTPDVSDFILSRAALLSPRQSELERSLNPNAIVAVSVLEEAYVALLSKIPTVNDDHMFQLFLEFIA